MRRRNWIIAAGAAVAVGAAYTSRHFIRGLQEGCWLPPQPPLPEKNVTYKETVFHSRVLNLDVGMVAADAQPAASRDGEPFFIFGLPGRDGLAAAHVRGLHLADYLGAAVRHGSRPAHMIVVDSGSSYWHARRGGEDRMKMLIEEVVLPIAARKRFNRNNMAIIGWSMGAYGAFLAAERYPELFGTVCGVSVAMWRSAKEQMGAVPDAFDDARDFERYDLRRSAAKLKGTRVRLACGESDPFFAADQEFAAVLRVEGIHPDLAFSAGCHDDNFWQRSAPADFAFLLGA